MSAATSLDAAPRSVIRLVADRKDRTGRHWKEIDDNALRLGWGVHSVEEVAASLGRTPDATYRRAAHLGLGRGLVQGFEYESHAAARTGFSRGTFRRLLVWAHASVRPAASKPGSVGHDRMIEPHEADRAVVAWCACETLVQAAARFGVAAPTIGRWLAEDAKAGLVRVPARAFHKTYRVPRATFDAVVARRRSRECVTEAAVRIGVSGNTLRRWLRAANVARPSGNLWLVEREVVDRIANGKREAGNSAFRTRNAGGESS